MRKLELLSKHHDREGFDCGTDALNAFLRQTARQHSTRGISRTYVLIDGDAAKPEQIIGFFTVNICQLKSEQLPAAHERKFPRDVAGIKLSRLAVAKGFQRQGVGKLLLIAAMRKCLEVFETAGGIGLFVDAKDLEAKAYYQQFGFEPLPSNELQLFLPLDTIREALANI